MTPEELRALKRGYSTRKEFAEALGVSPGSVARWESGGQPSARAMRRIREFSGEQVNAEKEIEKLKAAVEFWREKYMQAFFAEKTDESILTKTFRKMVLRYHPDCAATSESLSREEIIKDLLDLWEQVKGR